MAGTAVPFGTSSVTDDLFLKLYTGEFVAAPRSDIFLYDDGLPGIFRKKVTEGKEFQAIMEAFDPSAEDFEPGNQLLGQNFEEAEVTITPDKFLVAHHKIPRDVMLRSHFDVLPRRARQHKGTLSREMDFRLMITLALAARTTALSGARTGATVHNGGNRVVRAGGSATSDTAVSNSYPRSSTGAANFMADLRQHAQQLDEDNLPDGPRNRAILMTPYLRNVLQFDTSGHVWDRDFVDVMEGNKVVSREVKTIAGFRVAGFPNKSSGGGPMPNENITTKLSKYNANFAPGTSQGTPVALTMCNTADGAAPVGLITFEEIQHRVIELPDQLCWLVMSFTYAGCGKLFPWAAGSIEVSNTGT